MINFLLKRSLLIIVVFTISIINLFSQTPTWNWANDIHSNQDEVTTDVEVDPSTGDIYVVGYWDDGNLSAVFGAGAGSRDFSSTYGNIDGFVAKYDNTGALQWAFKIGCNQRDEINAISIDPSGNFYITGFFADNTAEFIGTGSLTGSTTLVNADNDDDFFLAKYNSNGELLWVRQGNSTGGRDISGEDIAAYSTGVFAVGYYNDDTNFGALTVTDVGSFNQHFIVAYDSNGNEQWVAYGATNNHDYNTESYFNSVATDGTNVFISGNYKGPTFGLYDNSNTLVSTVNNTNDGDAEIVLISFTVGGGFNWIQSIAGNNHDEDRDIILDNDSIYLTGGIGNNANFPGYSGNPVTSSGNMDIFISSHGKIDGNTGWVQSISSTNAGDQIGNSITIDSYSNILITGNYDGTLDFSGTNISPVGGEDAFIASFTNGGTFYWAKTIGSGNNDQGLGISSNSTDKVYVGGSYASAADLDGNLLANDGGDNAFLAQIDPCVDAVGGLAATADANICVGENTTITLVGYTGSIQWQSTPSGLGTWVNIAGETAANIVVSPVASTDYRAVVGVLSCNPDTSNVLTITVNPLPTATISGNSTICTGTATNITTTFSQLSNYTYVITDGTANYTYVVVGVDSDVRSFTPLVNTTYTLVSVVNNLTGCSGTVSGSAVISIHPTVNITTQPANKDACPADNISFNVVSDGIDLTYNWEFDNGGGYVPVGNLQSFAINGVDATDEGTYRVTVNSTTCPNPKVSNEVILSVGNTTVITSDPSDVDACDGTSHNFEVSANGDNISYEWRENGVAINTLGDPNYFGFNTPVLTVNNVDNTYDGNVYTCLVSGDCGNILSNPATLNVDDPIVITTQPINKTTCPGSDITYTVAATGTNLEYQWQANGVDIPGAIAQDLLLISVDAVAAAKTYKCKISSPCGAILYSDDVTLTLYTEINITTQPVGKTICENSPVNFQVASDGSNKQYKWQFDDGTGYIDIVGATSPTYTIASASAANEGDYRCIVSNTCGSEISSVATLIVDDAITVTDEPDNVEACLTDDISFTLSATGKNKTYQWQYDNGVGFVNLPNGAHPLAAGSLVSGVNNSTLNIDGIELGTDTDYRCLITNGCGTVISSIATLTIHETTALDATFPTDKNRCIGETANFAIVVTNGTVLSYKWQFDADKDGVFVDLNDGVQGSGAVIPVGSSNSNSLSVTNLFSTDAGMYRCKVEGVCGTVYSDVAELNIDEPVNITINPVSKMACETEDITFSVNATGSGLAYQWWEANGAAADAIVPAAVNPNLVLTNIDASYEDDYYCVVTNSCNSQTSGLANLTLYTPISISNDPDNITRCEGGDAAFNITVSALSDNPVYQWFQDGNPISDGINGNGATISGATTNSLFISDITTAEAGVYTCEVDGPCNTESKAANLVVNDSIIINTNPASKLVCPGLNTSFIVNASGDITNYKWQFDDLSGGGFVDLANNATYSGVSTTTLLITNTNATEVGIYRCVVTGSCIGNEVFSNSANLTLGEPTNIALADQPVDVTECEGQDISFSLTATGTDLTYQWYKNPAVAQVELGDFSGVTTNTLTISNITDSYEGVYYCVVSGTCGNVTSGTPVLTVNDGLTINTQPVSKTICEGLNTTYVVNASGDINGYQWQYNDGSGFVNLGNGAHPSGSSTVSGATTNTLSLAGVNSGDEGTYRCVIDGVCEDQNSSPAGLTVAINTAIITDPLALSLCETDEAIFSVDATGTGLSFEWYKASQIAPLANGVDVSGATTNTLTLSNLTAPDADVYSCIVSGFCNDETSLGANLNVSEHIVINNQPTNKIACPGGTASFNVNATGDIVSYQWYKDGIDISTLPADPNIINHNTATLTINNLTVAYAADYRCKIIGDCETINTNSATLTVNVTTTSTNPTNVINCEGETVTFSVTTTGTSLDYQWYKNGVLLSDGGQPSGSTFSGTESSTLVIDNSKPADNGSYHCIVDGACTDITTNTATLTIHPTTTITLQPSDIAVVNGGAATFNITAEGDIDFYQWYKNGSPVVVAGNIAAVDQPILTIDPVIFGSDEGDYHCVAISTGCGNANSNTAALTVLPATYVSTQPASAVKCEGEDLVLTITTTGGPHTYEWQFDDGTGYAALNNGAHISGSSSNVSGATTTSLIITNIQPDDQGFYRCVLNGGADISNSALITVNEGINIVNNPLDKERCLGDPVTFSINATGSIDGYQWYNSSGLIAGENSTSYTIASVDLIDIDSYYCIIDAKGTCANITSSSANLTVNSLTILNSGPPAQPTMCEGESVTLSVDASGSNLTYQWFYNTDTLNNIGSISGSNEKDLVISNALVSDQGNYYCEITGACGNESTVPVLISIDDATTITTQPISRSKCIGDQVQFSVVAEGTSLSYQWYQNGITLGAAGQTPILTIDPITAFDAGNYYCEITSANGCGDITSNAATLNAFDATAITSVFTDDTICEGTSHTLTVTATGGNLSYVWIRDNDTLTNGPNLNGVNTASLEIIDATINESGRYWCSVTGFCGPTILTNAAEIKVDPITKINTEPIFGEVCLGDNKLFIVEAEGLDLTYDWKLDGNSIGVNASQLNISPVNIVDAGSYTCYVSSNNGCGDVLTTPAELIIHEPTSINVHPLSDIACVGSTKTLSVEASGGDLQYQWVKDGLTVLSDGGNLSGTKTKNLLITGVTSADDGVYTCEVSGFCGDLISNPADLTVRPVTVINSSPISKTKCKGNTVTFYVTATGSNLTYQWQKGTTNLADGPSGNGSVIFNSLTNSLTISDLAIADAGSFRCVVTGDCGVQNSAPAILIVNDSTSIVAPPLGGTYCEGEEITINLSASGDNLTYQWKKDGIAISDTGSYAGTQTATLIISNSTTTYEGTYSCLVSGACGNKNSITVNVEINEETQITKQPQNKTKCEGDAVVFTVNALGSNLTYQWEKDGSALSDIGTITGSSTSILTISNAVDLDDGLYKCIVSGDCGVVDSDAANLTVNVYPDAATVITGPASVCQGNTNVIYEVAAIDNSDYYIWSFPVGMNILSGDSTRLIEVEFDINELGGNVSVRGINSCGLGVSSPILTVTANAIPIANAGADQSICVDTTYLDAEGPGTGTGTWSVIEGPGIVQNVNLNNSFISNLREGSNTLVWTLNKNSCVSTDTMVIINNHVNVDAGIDKTICTKDLVLEGSSVPTGATGSWSVVSGSASFDDGNDPITTATGFTTDLNILKWTITKSGCSTFDTIVVDYQRPTDAYAGIDQSICSDTTVLSANTPTVGIGEWTVVTGAAAFDDKNDPNTIVRGLSKGNNILRWTTSNGICSTIDEVTISNNIVNVNAGIDQILCDRTTVLSAVAPVTGTGNWSVITGSATFVNNNLNNTTVTGLAQGDNILAWNINNNGCISRDKVLITNNSPSGANAGIDQVLTADFTTLQATNPTIGIGEWSLISGSAVITNDTLYNSGVTDLALGDNVFRWTVTHNSCILTDDVIITNFMSTATDAGEDQSVCSDETTLDGSEPLFGFGEWSVIQGAATFFDNSDPKTKVSGLAQGDNILQWSIWENGWTSDDVIISNDSPTKANAGVDQVICSDSTNLAANNPIIGKGHWTVISGSGTFENDSIYNTKVTNLAKGKNIFKWTVTNKSCSSTDLVSVTNNLPTTADAGLDQTTCIGTVDLNPNTPSLGTGEWSVLSGAATFAGNTASNLAKDDNILRWTIVNNGCSSYDDVTITNHEPSDANAGADKIICSDAITLSANMPTVGTAIWTVQSGAANISSVNSNVPDVTNLSQGLNVFRWTVTYNGCTKFDEVIINSALIEAITGPDQIICDETTVLEANNPGSGSGSWSVLGGSGAADFESINQPDTRVSGLDKGDNILRWTITNEICVSHSDVVIRNDLPTDAFAGPDQALCADNSILQANTPIDGIGEWSILSGSADIADVDNPSSIVNNLDYGVNTLRWTITKGSCTSSDEVVIANNSTITSNAGVDQVLCADSAILYANIPAYGTGTWSVIVGSATFEDNNDYNTKVTNVGKGDNTLRWAITNGGCSSADQVKITNNSPSKAIAGADQTICGDSTFLQANIPSKGTGTWTLVSGAAHFISPDKNNTQVTNLNPGSNTLRWTIENGGCESSDDVVIYNDLPYVADAGGDFEICSNTSPLYANDPVIGEGKWTVVSGSASFSDESKFDATVTDLGFGANTLRWTIDYDACNTYDEIVITNNKIDVYAGVDQEINESSTLLAASNPSTGQGQWLVIGGAGVFENKNKAITVVSSLGGGLNTFRWSVDINGCISSDDVSIKYNIPPEASFVITSSQGCPPLNVYFVNNSLDNLPFTWDFDDGTTSDQITVKHTYTEPGVYKPKLTIVSETGDIISKDTIIKVYDQPEASFLVVNQQVYIPEEEAIFINTSVGAETYKWNFGDGSTSTESDPKYVYPEEGIFDVFLEVWSDNNCYDSVTISKAVEVMESGALKFPNAFTPNLSGPSGGYYNPNDFSNDVFYPIGDGISEYHLEIFNKWGIIIFESKDISIGWDGYYKEKLVNEGVYVWKVTGKLNNGKEFKKVGTVILLR